MKLKTHNPSKLQQHDGPKLLRQHAAKTATQLNRPSTNYTQKLRKKMWQDNPYCNYCGCILTPLDYELDHIRPLHLGGGNELSNFQILCKACHKEKSRKENIAAYQSR